jgi:hypothetical protein
MASNVRTSNCVLSRGVVVFELGESEDCLDRELRRLDGRGQRLLAYRGAQRREAVTHSNNSHPPHRLTTDRTSLGTNENGYVRLQQLTCGRLALIQRGG